MANLAVAFPAIRDMCAEVVELKGAQWYVAGGFHNHAVGARVVRDLIRALSLEGAADEPVAEKVKEIAAFIREHHGRKRGPIAEEIAVHIERRFLTATPATSAKEG